MLHLPIAEVVAGMYVAKDVRTETNRMLLPYGALLTAERLAALKQCNIPMIYVNTDPPPKGSVEERLADDFRTLIESASEQFAAHAQTRRLTFEPRLVEAATKGIMEEVLANPKIARAVLTMHEFDSYLFQHSFNAAVTGSILAQRMKYSNSDCRALALGLLFHDCGRMFLPQEVFAKADKLTPEEKEIIRQHCRKGYDYVIKGNLLPAKAADVVLHHHERMNGAGYPDGLSGDSISNLARIAAVVEAFDAMTSLQRHARSKRPNDAMRIILEEAGITFSREVALHLAKYVAMYTVGTAVRLNTGESGIVVDTAHENITRPIVRLYYDADNSRIRPRELNLAQDSARWIAATGPNLDAVRPQPGAGSYALEEPATETGSI